MLRGGGGGVPSSVEKTGNSVKKVANIILNFGIEEKRRSNLNVRINRIMRTTRVSMIVQWERSVVA